MAKFDDVFERIGKFGRYQKILYLLLCLPAIPGSTQIIQMVVFLLAVPKHRCAIPGMMNDTYRVHGPAHQHLLNITIPTETGFYGEAKYSQCKLYDLTNTSIQLLSPETNNTVRCNQWVFDKSVFESTIASTMDLVCDKKWLVSVGKMMGMIGQLVGAVINGPLSDMFGRRPVLIGNMILLALMSVVLVWVRSVILLMVVICVIFQCALAQYMVAFVFGVEIVSPSKRKWVVVCMNLFWSLGNLVTVLSTYILREWKTRQLIVSVPIVLFAYLYFIPESPRWLLKHGKREEAAKVVQRIARGNGVKVPEDVLDDIVEEEHKREPFWTLFRSPVLMKRMLVICFNWFAVGMGFYGLSMNVTNLAGSIYLNFFLFVIIEIAAYLMCLVLIERIGRKRLLCTSALATGLTCMAPLVPVLISDQPNKWAINIFAIVGNTCASAAMCAVYAFTAELLPTTARNAGMGFSSAWCRIGSLISPYIVDLTMHVTGRLGQILPMIIIGVIAATAGLLALLLPETMGQKLPETIAEAEKLGTDAYTRRESGPCPTELALLHSSPETIDERKLENTTVS